jgi:hypothetical protein
MERNQSIKETLTHPENRELIADWLAANKGRNRTNLAAYACERLSFRDAKGRLRISTTLKALRDLEAEGCWRLPESTVNATGRWNPRRLDCAVAAPRGVPGQVEEIKGLELVEVRAENEAYLRIWNEMMLSEHPLRDCRLVGRQLRFS